MGKYSVHLVGESFGGRQKNILRASEGQRVLLIRDPENPHSLRGTAILATLPDGSELGNIGEKNGGWISSVIDTKKPIEARIKSITGGYGGKEFKGIILEVLTGEDVGRDYRDFEQPTFSPSKLKFLIKLTWVLIGLLVFITLIILIF